MLTEGKGESPSCEQSKKLTSLQRLRGNAGALINTEKKIPILVRCTNWLWIQQAESWNKVLVKAGKF